MGFDGSFSLVIVRICSVVFYFFMIESTEECSDDGLDNSFGKMIWRFSCLTMDSND